LCLGARIIGEELARSLVRAFVSAQFSPDPRFQRRLDKVIEIETEQAQSLAEGGLLISSSGT
jgi:ribose 5-phosphate isomerase B